MPDGRKLLAYTLSMVTFSFLLGTVSVLHKIGRQSYGLPQRNTGFIRCKRFFVGRC